MSRVTPLGEGALRIDLPRAIDRRRVLDRLQACPGVVDVVVAELCVCVYFDPTEYARVENGVTSAIDTVIAQSPVEPLDCAPRVHTVRVRYDGADFDDIAARAGVSRAELIALHSGRTYTVSMVGFLPGFAYLSDVPSELVFARRSAPRPRVPRGAVAIAGRYTGIYPVESPGGWHLLGSAVDFRPFTPEGGAALGIGEELKFEVVE